MFLKIILVIVILFILYRLLGGKVSLPSFKGDKKSQKSQKRELEANTLVECNRCGIYITKQEAIKKRDKFYCSECK
jgi:formamidopyrimidine-DNA glycosylase